MGERESSAGVSGSRGKKINMKDIVWSEDAYMQMRWV